MAYTCIGKRVDFRGKLSPCSNESPVPSNPARPDWGYLCAECSSSPKIPRPSFQAAPFDLDKPNQLEPIESEGYGQAKLAELDRDDFDSILELDSL